MESVVDKARALRAAANARLSPHEPLAVLLMGAGCLFAYQCLSEALDRDADWKGWFFRRFLSVSKAIPSVRAKIEQEQAKTVDSLRAMLRIENDEHRHPVLPEEGIDRSVVLGILSSYRDKESEQWLRGGASGAVYHGDRDHIDFINAAYAMFSVTNPLHTDLFKSLRKFEAEIVSMAAHMLNGDPSSTCGAVTFGGTESILMAMKAYRDRAARERGITRPNIVVASTAHAAFIKAGDYFKIAVRRVPARPDGTADARAMARACDSRTICIVGSAPQFPSGIVDPIEDLAKIARGKGIGLHVDGCLGGFFLPFARAAGHYVPPFDFAVEGVTSMSCDTHKYGFTAKGTSVVLFSTPELRHYMYSFCLDWSGGIYATPTHAGSRPGGLIASTWACLVSIGKKGYVDVIDGIVRARKRIVEKTRGIEGIEIIGDPQAMVIAYRDDGSCSIYDVLDHMSTKGWSLNGLQHPSSVHICLTRLHIDTEVQDRFISDLKEATAKARDSGGKPGGMAPIYGQASQLPDPSLLEDAVGAYLDATLDATI